MCEEISIMTPAAQHQLHFTKMLNMLLSVSGFIGNVFLTTVSANIFYVKATFYVDVYYWKSTMPTFMVPRCDGRLFHSSSSFDFAKLLFFFKHIFIFTI